MPETMADERVNQQGKKRDSHKTTQEPKTIINQANKNNSMITNIKKDLILNIITSGESGKCNGCIARRGSTMADVDQIIYITVSWHEKDYRGYMNSGNDPIKHIKENYCYGCAMDLFDNWRQEVREIY